MDFSKANKTPAISDSFSPVVLWSTYFNGSDRFVKGESLEERYIYDYELEFFTDSNGGMYIDKTYYPIQKGDIVFRKPGQYTQAIMTYNCYVFCFDLLGNTGKHPSCYDMISEQPFQSYYVNDILESLPSVYSVTATEKYTHLFETVLNAFINPDNASPLLLKSYVLQILYQLYQDTQNIFAKTYLPLSPHFMTLKKVISYIQNSFSQQLDLKQLSRMAEMSPAHFHKVFTKTLGITPNDFLTETRLSYAKELLVKSSNSITEIALLCGFENTPYFSYLFKNKLGITPGAFRRKHQYL